jgi:putative acetyltransferase
MATDMGITITDSFACFREGLAARRGFLFLNGSVFRMFHQGKNVPPRNHDSKNYLMRTPMLTFIQAETFEQVATARELMLEYAAWLEFNLCFQGFEEEMKGLPGKYAPPAGRLLLALWDGQPAGVIALRPMEKAEKAGDGICEMKRLYVRPAFRGHSIGRALAEKLIAEAREIGYRRMRLDTIPPKMDAAIAMYRDLGFAEAAPYYNSPVSQTIFMELELKPA